MSWGRSGGAAGEGHRVGGHTPNLELEMEVRSNRKPGAAHQTDLVALLHRVADRDEDFRHVRVDLDQPVAVGYLDANAEVTRGTHRRHHPARGRGDRGAVCREDV